MAVKQKVVLIDTGNAEKSVKSLKQELKGLKDELVNLEQGTQEYNQVLLQAANIQHDLTEMNQELAASAMDFGLIMGNTTATIGGAVAGFQALTASMSLLGVENEDALLTIKKLLSLMALSQGIAGVENGIKAFKRLTTAITNSTTITNLFNKATKTTAVTEEVSTAATKGLQGAMVGEAAATGTATVATQAFKKALISTGIGAIVVALGTLIAHLEDVAKWFGISGKEADGGAEKIKKWDAEIKKVTNSTSYYDAELQQMEYEHQKEIEAMEDLIERMKAEGKSEAEIAAQREKNNARLKEITDEELAVVDKSQTKIEEYFKKAKNYNINMTNVYKERLQYLRLIMQNEEIIKKLEAGEKVAGYTKDSIEYLKSSNVELNEEINMMTEYINLGEKEDKLNRRLTDAQNKAYNERAQNAKKAADKRREELKKLKEDYDKFNKQLLIDTKTEKDKELETINQAEAEKLKKLKEYQEKGVISTAQYNEQRTVILEMYAKKRNEIEFKYEEQASKKREEVLKKQYELEKSKAERNHKLKEAQLEQEHIDNLNALNKREISLVDYYNREKDIIAKNYYEQSKLLENDFKNQTNLINEQINERYELLQKNGLSEDQRNKLLTEVAEMSNQLLTIEADHNIALQNLANETNMAIAETTRSALDVEIEGLHTMVDNVVSSMDAIAACGDGISTAWAGAFETLGNGLVDLTEKIKAGGAQWQDYAQLAVVGLLAASQVMNGLASQLDAQNKEGFEKQKKYQIAAATMSMLAGIATAFSGAFTMKMGPWDWALAAIQAGIIATTGAIQIAKIKQQKFEGGSSSAGSTPSSSAMATVVAPVQYTQDVQGAAIEGSIKDTKVYVTETDISDTQNKVDVAESEARY